MPLPPKQFVPIMKHARGVSRRLLKRPDDAERLKKCEHINREHKLTQTVRLA